MAGIYIHVPFCKKRCIYCDFFTQTDIRQRSLYVDALSKEIFLRKGYIENEKIKTIYLGGGTPSQLKEDELAFIFQSLNDNFEITDNAEITIEVNPDDINIHYLNFLRKYFNRISIGIQSFNENMLHFLGRRHTSLQALNTIDDAKRTGFKNISIDLMYGLPNQDLELWQADVEKAMSLGIQHISAYHLIYEQGTPLYKLKSKNEIAEIDEETSLEMFSLLIEKSKQNGFIHYEISNFANEGYFSRHNSSYWTGEKYLGLGPAAHSYNKKSREYNINSIPLYIEGINNKKPLSEVEPLDCQTRYNEYILTGLRTMWGIDIKNLREFFGENLYLFLIKNARTYLDTGYLRLSENKMTLTEKGLFISDKIMSDLMKV